MAIFKSTTFGKISGKFGEAVATQSKATGKNYLRVATVPTNPRTPKQIEHRGRFGYVNKVMRPFYAVFKTTLGGNTGIRKGINIALKNAVIGTYPDLSLDYAKLEFTDGTLYQTNQVSVTKTEATTVKLDWNYSKMAGNEPNDQVNLIFYNLEAGQAILEIAVEVRESSTCTIELPDVWAGNNVACWIYFSSIDGSSVSVSQYVGQVQV